MKLILPRRKLLLGLAALITAPAIVRIENIMPVKSIEDMIRNQYWVYIVNVDTHETERVPLRGNNELLASRLLSAATASL